MKSQRSVIKTVKGPDNKCRDNEENRWKRKIWSKVCCNEMK